MDSSRRAVESYWRSRMIDAATSDEDKVTPVYKLEEVCELLRSSHVSIVKEVSDFILKRLEHKSPIVKQKALRLIKYAVGKSGVEFRREIQRHSAAIRQLFHYRGQPDPLKGDALNKAVRDTAHEAISAIFSEENKPATTTEDLNLTKRIQGFGSTNYEMPSEDKKSFLSEVVGIGSASIKQGLSSITQSHSLRKNDNGNYKSPNLRRSLTIESDHSDRYEPVQLRNETQGSYGVPKSVTSGPWGQDNRASNAEVKNGDSGSSSTASKTREERLLETIVTSGGVRLQPTRDAIQVFLAEAAKLNAVALSHALESKLQSPMWQVRMKAVCVLEAILRKKEDENFAVMTSFFDENKDVVVKCSESPQSSLREKSIKVLSLLRGEQSSGLIGNSEKSRKVETTSVHMPDLIDTGDSGDFFETDYSADKPSEQKTTNLTSTSSPFIDDLFGDGGSTGEQKIDDDPFADVSFHTSQNKEHADDLFSGMAVDSKQDTDDNHAPTNKNGPEQFDIFGSISELPLDQATHKTDVNDLMAGFSINENVSKTKQPETTSGVLPESFFSDLSNGSGPQHSNDALTGILGSQVAGINANPVFSSESMPYNIPPGFMLNPAFLTQPMNYGAMGGLLAQQQFLATMSNFQHLNNLNAQHSGVSHPVSTGGGAYPSALPDIFQSNYANQVPTSMMNNTKKEETRAFDFISDHLTSARDPKRVA